MDGAANLHENYTEKALEHFLNPRNVGVVENYNGRGKIGDPECGDVCEITLRIEEDKIADIKFRVQGCAGAISTSSATTVLAKGKSTEEALQINDDDVIEYLGGLPEQKKHCSLLSVRALRQAIYDYWFYQRLLDSGQVSTREEHEQIRAELFQQFASEF
ncbi:MAG: iron-sulfur cluster assembly scaffold protein [Desulfotomaculum sp.]|nr:iron-sulfur cluster assembly scaffold protein [Desulfotomaculum sp.]